MYSGWKPKVLSFICHLGLAVKSKAQPYLYCILVNLIFLPTAYPAAWVMDKGKWQVINNFNWYESHEFWDKKGHLHSSPDTFRQFSYNPYLELGLLRKLTLVLSPLFKSFRQGIIHSDFAADSAEGGLRYAFHKKDWTTISLQLTYNVPFRSPTVTNQQFSQTNPASVYGIINRFSFFDFRYMFGTGGPFDKAKKNTWYFDFELAYRLYLDGAADEVHSDFMFGWKPWEEKLVLEVKELNTFSIHNPHTRFNPNYNLITIVPSLTYFFNKYLGIQVGAYQDLWGTNIGKGTTTFFAVWIRYK